MFSTHVSIITEEKMLCGEDDPEKKKASDPNEES